MQDHAISMATPAQRLRAARVRLFKSATAAAQSNGWIGSTYAAHERGARGYRLEEALAYGEAFGVDPEYLLYGKVNEGKTDYANNSGDLPELFHVTRKVPHLDICDLDIFGTLMNGKRPKSKTGLETPLPSSIQAGPRAYSVTIEDRALAGAKPSLEPGMIGFFDPDRGYSTGDIVAAIVEGFPSLVCRKFRLLVEGGKTVSELASLDPDCQTFRSDSHRMQIVGRLVGLFVPV